MIENCRVCLSCNNKSMENLTDTRNEESVAELLSFISGVKIELKDELPQKICVNCMNQVISASEIKRKIIATEKALHSKIKDETQIKLEQYNDPVTELAVTEFCLLTSEEFNINAHYLNNDDSQNRASDAFDNNIRKSLKRIRVRTKNTGKKRPVKIVENDITKSERKNKVPNEMDYKCFICDKIFDKIWTKNKHVKIDHENARICKICNVKCKTPISLETHVKFHFRDYGFMCEICSKTFRYRNRLNSHMTLHHAKAAEMVCDLCGLSTKFKNNIKRHMKSVHMKLREFHCSQCSGHEYSTQEALNSHLYRYHNFPAPIRCADCQHGFTFDSELRAHKRHGFCSKNVNAPLMRRLKIDYDYLEVVDGEHLCKLCNETFPTKHKFSMHNYLKHKYSNKCDECNIVFTNYTSLIRHEKVKHQGHKPFKCEFCFKCFGQKVSLTSHRNTHTGEKTFECAYCPFKSGDRRTVSKHKKKIHPEMMMSTSKVSTVETV